MTKLSSTAIVLAAGFGTRMRPLTLTKPKPLFEVGGRTMLDLAIDKLVATGVTRIVVNVFYLAEQIIGHLNRRTDIEIIISHEQEVLETGGGVKQALHYFDGQPFFALNADLPWIDTDVPSLAAMRDYWNPETMDALLLVMPTDGARGFDASGNFFRDQDGRLTRHNRPPPRPYVMISAQILKPQSFDNIAEKIFSNAVIWDAAETRDSLFGFIHPGTCYHVGTPEDLQLANDLLASGKSWATGA